MDGAGNLCVVDSVNNQIQKRDTHGSWSIIAISGTDLSQISSPSGLAADTVGDLYVADQGTRVQKRDARGNWSVIATVGSFYGVHALATDIAGDLYVADGFLADGDSRIVKRDAQGNWSLIAVGGAASVLGQVEEPSGLAADRAGNLYVADAFWPAAHSPREWEHRIQRRDALGSWSTVATQHASALAVDTTGNLYFANSQIQKRDVQGTWSVIEAPGGAVGQMGGVSGLAVDPAGNLYVADSDNSRVLEYMPAP